MPDAEPTFSVHHILPFASPAKVQNLINRCIINRNSMRLRTPGMEYAKAKFVMLNNFHTPIGEENMSLQ